MIDERRIDDKTKYGTQYNVGNITLYVTCKFWGGRWHIPAIQLIIAISQPSMLDRPNVLELDYDALEDIAEASRKAQREWMRVARWRSEKNREISKNSLGAPQ